MEKKTLLNIDELAERWGVDKTTIRRMREKGEIKAVKAFGNLKFNINDVLKIEGSGSIDPLSPMERRRLELEIKNKDNEIARLNAILSKMIAPLGEYISLINKEEVR
jgi:hypothetical protein|nr:MAG TPA: helix-turn-helix domain protein [Caudoviricetes sp.]